MKKKLLIMLMSLVACVCCFFGIAACDNSEEGSSDWANGIFTVETAYAEAQDLGYSGTLEDFIASISGSNGVGISSVTLNSDGELVITLSDTTTLNLGVIKGADGKDGTDGQDGANGQDGKDGATWYNGTYAAMSDVTANEGDYYLTTDTYAVYTYTSGSWTLVITSIKGEDGDKGDTGAQGAAGATGKDGADGADGATWYTGSGAPEATTGTDGDMYLDTSSYDIYQMTDGTWTKIGNIKGAAGEDGKDGEDGEDGQDLTADTVTLTFDANGGELTDEEDNTVESYSIEVTKGDSVDLPVPTRSGYKFLGWYYSTGTNAGQVTDVTSITRDMTITAKWGRAYEMSLSYLDNTTMTESGSTYFEGYYESTFSTYGENNITIEIEIDSEVYSVDEAISNGYIGDYYIYNENSWFYGNIYFTAVGEYTVYLTYGYSSITFDVTVNAYVFTGSVYVSEVLYYNNYYGYGSTTATASLSDVNSAVYRTMWIYFHAPSDAEVSVTLDGNSVDYSSSYYRGTYQIYFTPKAFVGNTIGTYTFVVTVSSETYGSATATINYTLEQAPDFYYTYELSSNVRVNNSTDFELYYYGDCAYDYPVVTISDGTNTYTIDCTEGWNYRTITDDNGEVLYCNFYYDGGIYISGYFCFYAVGNYTVTINFGEDSDSFEIAVTNFESNVENTEIYTDNYSYFYVNYYGDSEYDYPEIAITSTEGYSYTYSITGTFGYGADDSTEDTDATTSLWAYWYGGSYMENYVYFYAPGTYTVTISFGEDSVSYTVTVTDYVFEGETALEYIYWDGNSISNNAEITEYASEGYTLLLVLDAPEDYVVTVAIDGEEIESYNSGKDWNYGTLRLYIYPLQLVDYTAGEYTLTVTVSSENNGSATATFSYVVEQTPAYVEYVEIEEMTGESYSISDGVAVQYTNAIPASYSGVIDVCIYAENPEVTVTLNGTALTQDEDWYLVQSDNWYYVCIYASVLEVSEASDFVFEGMNGKGTTNTIVVTADSDNGTATATLSIISAIWVYFDYTSEEVAENGNFYMLAEYCYDTEDDLTITIESTDGYTYTYTLTDGENALEDDQEEVVTYIDVYVSTYTHDNVYTLKEVYGYVYFNIAGEYTVTVSCGSSSIVVVKPYDYEGVDFGSATYSSDSGETSYNIGLTEAEEQITISGTTLVTYYFIPVVGGTITITTIGSIDTYGYLYLDGNCIDVNDDGGESMNFLISYDVTAGKLYEIRVCGYDDEENGTATLSISGIAFVYGASSDISLPEDEDIVFSDNVGSSNNEMYLTFKAAKDSTVTVKIDGVEIDSEDIVSYTWDMGTLTVYVSLELYSGTAGEYTIEVTVSSEMYSCSDSAVVIYKLV